MIGGPVFGSELLTTARRGRYYLARAGYAVVLLLILWQVFEIWQEAFGQMMTPRMVSQFALSTLLGLAVWQEILVLALTPALMAGAIAGEKQSKTLHYMLASPLGSAEIVLGKLFARMLHVAVWLAVGLPIFSLLVLLGGVDPRLVVLGCAAAGSSAFFLAGLSILVSVHARRVREALFLAYGLELVWLLTPDLIRYGLPVWLPYVDDVNEWLLAISPLSVGREFVFSFVFGVGLTVRDLVWMIGFQTCAGAAFVALAAWRLRPVFLRQEGGRRRLGAVLKSRGRARVLARPACADRPIVWKECHTSRSTVLSRVIGWAVALAVGAPIVYWTIRLFPPAFEEAWAHGFSPSLFAWPYVRERYLFRAFLLPVVSLLSVLGLFGIAGAAAASVTSEHEDDTWTSLTSTDLSGREIVLGKIYGALRAGRGIGLAIGVLVALGAAAESVHPLGILAVGVAIGVFAWFAAALGVWISLQVRSTWRAQFLTIGLLILVNLVGQGAYGLFYPFDYNLWPGFMPLQIAWSLFGAEDQPHIGRRLWVFSAHEFGLAWKMASVALNLAWYAALAALLTWASLHRFETTAGRPRRPRRPRLAPDGPPVPSVDVV